MDEIGGKHFSLWKISALLDGVGISDEMSQPIRMAMLHHFFIQRIAVITFKCSELLIKALTDKTAQSVMVKCKLGKCILFHNGLFLNKPEWYAALSFSAKLHYPCI